MYGDDDILVQARSALLDALDALQDHRDSVIIIGAQAIYLHTGSAQVALAEATKDSDLVLDVRSLGDDPRIEVAVERANFTRNPESNQPGAWVSPTGIPVDLMVPEALAGKGGRRGARIPPHASNATRRTTGLEAAVVDNAEMDIPALSSSDLRVYQAKVAGPAALLVAKLHKLGERQDTPTRLVDKDAHDIYRIVVTVQTEDLAARLRQLQTDGLAGQVTNGAIDYLNQLFAAGPNAIGSLMPSRAETGVGDPEVVSASVAALSADLVRSLGR
jgi:hypothetical protein